MDRSKKSVTILSSSSLAYINGSVFSNVYYGSRLFGTETAHQGCSILTGVLTLWVHSYPFVRIEYIIKVGSTAIRAIFSPTCLDVSQRISYWWRSPRGSTYCFWLAVICARKFVTWQQPIRPWILRHQRGILGSFEWEESYRAKERFEDCSLSLSRFVCSLAYMSLDDVCTYTGYYSPHVL